MLLYFFEKILHIVAICEILCYIEYNVAIYVNEGGNMYDKT